MVQRLTALSFYSLDSGSCCHWLWLYPSSFWYENFATELWFTHSFTHSFNPCLLSTYYVPGSVLGTGDIATNKAEKIAVLMALILWWERKTQTNKYRTVTNSWKKMDMNARQGCVRGYYHWVNEEGLYDEVTRWFKPSSSQNNFQFTLPFQSLNFWVSVLMYSAISEEIWT